MPFKSLDFLTHVPVFVGQAISRCIRMQQRVNRRHVSLTTHAAKDPQFDA